MSYDDYKLDTPPENDTKCYECGKEAAHWDLHIAEMWLPFIFFEVY